MIQGYSKYVFFVHLFLLQDLIASDTNDLDEWWELVFHLLMFEAFWISPLKDLGARRFPV